MTNLPFTGKFKVTQLYGVPGNYQAGYHTGMDIVGVNGNTTIYSVCDGRVTLAGWNGDYGNCVKILDNATGETFLFAHLASISVSVNQSVSRATKIGVMGNTENSNGAHLHLEMRKTDSYWQTENPAPYIMGMQTPTVGKIYNSAGFQIVGGTGNVPNMTYKAYVQNIGWQGEVSNGAMAGTTGQNLRLEAFKLQFI